MPTATCSSSKAALAADAIALYGDLQGLAGRTQPLPSCGVIHRQWAYPAAEDDTDAGAPPLEGQDSGRVDRARLFELLDRPIKGTRDRRVE